MGIPLMTDVGLGHKVGHIGPGGTNLRLFQIRFQYILADMGCEKSGIYPTWGQSEPLWSRVWHPYLWSP